LCFCLIVSLRNRSLIGSTLDSFDDSNIRSEISTVKITRTRTTTTILPIDVFPPKKTKTFFSENSAHEPHLSPNMPQENERNARECDIFIVYMRDAFFQANKRDLVKRIDQLAKLLIINTYKQNHKSTLSSMQQKQYQQNKKLTVLTATMKDVYINHDDKQSFIDILNGSKVICLCTVIFIHYFSF
jgi:hypothetical protein